MLKSADHAWNDAISNHSYLTIMQSLHDCMIFVANYALPSDSPIASKSMHENTAKGKGVGCLGLGHCMPTRLGRVPVRASARLWPWVSNPQPGLRVWPKKIK